MKNIIIKNTTFAFLFTLGSFILNAKENVEVQSPKKNSTAVILANNCNPSTSQIEMDLNNVRMTLLGAGDFWWDLSDAKYEIPKGSKKTSVFAGSIWVGGYTPDGNLKVAAMTYRQTGVDFWPGPIDSRDSIELANGTLEENPNFGSTSIGLCNDYDKHFVVNFDEVSDFYTNCIINGSVDESSIPTSIKEWPGNGVNGEFNNEIFAPFNDLNNNNLYEPELCEYPHFDGIQLDANGSPLRLDCSDNSNDLLFGDRNIFWVYNDKGNVHTESGTEAIGLEIRAQAFAYTTNDELNDMTFYNYRILNHANVELTKTYFGTWVDSDVGNFNDDYVGCDVNRGLGYTYNGDNNDDGALGYGTNPPALGLDFFKGPLADEGDGIDNDRDGCMDCTYNVNNDGSIDTIPDTVKKESIIMSKFMFYNNTGDAVTGNPSEGIHFYNFLEGKWKNGQSMTYGSTGNDASLPDCDFMFPEDTDPNFSEPWTEESVENNPPADRRFLTSAGPFTLEPGALNVITTGVVWARATDGGPFASVRKMKLADDKAQLLFDNCFEVLAGPESPDVSFLEKDKEITMIFDSESTERIEKFELFDPRLNDPTAKYPINDKTYNFEGYQIFQLADPTVSPSDFYNQDKARLVGQSDIENYRFNLADANNNAIENPGSPIANLVNFTLNQDIGAYSGEDKTILAANEGLKHHYTFTQDAFTNKSLINGTPYYYTVVAYAHNEYMQYTQDVPYNSTDSIFAPNSLGQKLPFLAGRKNIKTYTVVPKITNLEKQVGTYEMRVPLTRLQGEGSGGYELKLTEKSIKDAVENYCVPELDYAANGTPVNLFVVDPTSVPVADFKFELLPLEPTNDTEIEDANWILIKDPGTENADTVFSMNSVSVNNDQIISKWGLGVDIDLSVETPFVEGSEDNTTGDNGYLSSSITPEDGGWVEFIKDRNYPDPANWILSGSTAIPNQDPNLSGTSSWLDKYSVSDIRFKHVGGNIADNQGTIVDDSEFADPKGIYSNVVDGGWSPMHLASPFKGYPGYPSNKNEVANNNPHLHSSKTKFAKYNLVNLFSVKIVLTDDKSKWTRVPVIEASQEEEFVSFQKSIKNVPSVDKNGNADNSGNGFSWFPGYAINKHNGNRLNMAFAEDSSLPEENGNDMIWNPTSNMGTVTTKIDSVKGFIDYEGEVLGGRHFIYVFASQYKGDEATDNPHYDLIQDIFADNKSSDKRTLFSAVSWTAMPLLKKGRKLNSGKVEIDINISQPLKVWESDSKLGQGVCVTDETNSGYPKYTFATSELPIIEPGKINGDNSKTVLDYVSVVPNPYYGGASYETTPNSHMVKVLNLPRNSVVTIYNSNGTLIRKQNIDAGGIYEWDLKNRNNVSIASGLYIIHIDSPIGEKTIKWFGALRSIDLDSY